MINYNDLEESITREIHKRSFYQFYKEAFAQLHPGQEYDENWHAQYLCSVFQAEFERIKIYKKRREKDIIVNMPFRSSKSLIATVIFPIWCWTIESKTKFICVSYSEDLALEHAKLARDLIYRPWFQKYYGKKVILSNDAVSFYRTSEGGYRKSVGTGGQITGSGGDIIIVDDPQNPKLAASEKERQNTKNFYNHTLASRLNELDRGVRIIVMQRLHEEDLSGHLINEMPDMYQHINIPASIELEQDKLAVKPSSLIKNYVDNLFWSTRFSDEILNEYTKRLGDVQAAGQLQQRPAPPDGNLIKKEWISIMNPHDLIINHENEPVDFFIDTAYTERQMNDPSGIIAVFKRQGTLYILNAHSVRYDFPKLLDFLKVYLDKNGYTSKSRIFIEPKASGKSVAQQLKFSTKLNVIEIDNSLIKDDKMTRFSAVSPIIQSGRLCLVSGSWNDEYLNQLMMFPNAAHDEYVDLTTYAMNIEIPNKNFFWGFL